MTKAAFCSGSRESEEVKTVTVEDWSVTMPHDCARLGHGIYKKNDGTIQVTVSTLRKKLDGIDTDLTGIGVSDPTFKDLFVAYMNQGLARHNVVYSEPEDKLLTTDSGLVHKQVFSKVNDNGLSRQSIADIYEWNDEKFFIIEYNCSGISTPEAEKWIALVNDTVQYQKKQRTGSGRITV